MTPIVDGNLLTFEAGGLYDGLVVLRDIETKSYWNHITGECFLGEYHGKRLETDNLLHYTFEKALATYPDLKIAISKIAFPFSIFTMLSDRLLRGKRGFIPPYFRRSMAVKDDRLDEHTLGLGVVINEEAKFYDLEKIMEKGTMEDTLGGRAIIICFDEASNSPRCSYQDGGKNPLQLFTRWYGFAYTYPNCKVY